MRFPRAARSLILGIKIKDDPTAAIILQTDSTAFLRGQSKVGRCATWRGGRGSRPGEQARNEDSNRRYQNHEQGNPQHQASKKPVQTRAARGPYPDSGIVERLG